MNLRHLSEVKGISQSAIVTSVGNYWGTRMKYYANPNDSAGVYYNGIDENYIPLHEHQLLAGRNFRAKPDSSAESEVIVNQQVLKRFNIANQDPRRPSTKLFEIDGKDLRIIGVMKDFHYGQANSRTPRKKLFSVTSRERCQPTQCKDSVHRSIGYLRKNRSHLEKV